MTQELSSQPVAWAPSQQYIEQSNLFRFMRRNGVSDFPELSRKAAAAPEWFWEAVVKDLGLEWFTPYFRVLDLSEGIGWPKWFVGGSINLAYNCLDRNVRGGTGSRTALIWEGEEGSTRAITYAELLTEVNCLANGLRELGVEKGDRVGIFMPMLPEAAVAMLACMRVGAVFTPIFSGYGAQAVASRLQDCEAKLLVTADGFWRRGRQVNTLDVARQAVEIAGCVEKTVVVRRLNERLALSSRDFLYEEVLKRQPDECAPEATAAEDPFMIIYTSGTTGRPKGTVHVHAGFPIKAAQDLAHCFDMQPGDALFWVTDMGWMMGPWAVLGALLLRGTVVLYEGAPDYPNPGRLWEIVDKHAVNILGLSPTVIRALMPLGAEWVECHPMSALRVLGSTGEPWNPDPWWWYFEKVGHRRCPVINYSGGTEISGGIVGCFPIVPIKPCSFAGPIPGMDADVVDEKGEPVRGVVGELVLRSPWVGMTKGFWRDPDRYTETYWSRWPGVWAHGDLAYIDEEGYWYILGRSDDVIKVSGKRVGPAEVESILVGHPAVVEAAAIGVPHEVKGETIVCFVVLRSEYQPTEELRAALGARVTASLGKSLQPETIKFVADLPKTRSGKVVRSIIRAKYLNEQIRDLTAVENIEAVNAIADAT